MKPQLKKWCVVGLIVGVNMLLGAVPAAFAQKVPITFNDYHGYTGTVKYIQDVARAYPNITELVEIGKSNMGRTIYVLVISNMSTGTTIDAHVELRNMRREGIKNVTPMRPYQGKPGHWLGGSTHGNEYTGTEVCLYTINKLVSGYGSDSQITRLVDDKVFYICPIINPDGVYNSVEQDISQRANSMTIDDDNDGKINEDGPDDINGDGHITRFRYKDPDGNYIIDDVDPRLMVQLGEDETTTKQRYSILRREDIDNDGDGRRGEDSESGIDLNRNFPEGWFNDEGFSGGSGTYPTSAPEVHAVVEFFTNNTNILMSQFYHTSGGFTYRAMGTAPHTRMDPKDVAVFDRIMGKKYLELIGEEVPEAWTVAGPLDRFKEELRLTSSNKYAIERGYVLPRGWRVSYNEDADRRYSYGMATDWVYAQFGAFSITTELWNSGKDMKGIPQFTGEDANVQRSRALLKYQDEQFGGKFFIDWTPYRHPELGEGEVGGWISRYAGGNAFPGETLEGVCDIHCQFELFRAGLMPEVVITDARANVLYTTNNASEASVLQQGYQVTIKKGDLKGEYKVVEVTAVVENIGKLATHLARGAQLAGNRQDAVWLIGDRDKMTFLQGTPVQRIGVLEGTMPIPGFEKPDSDQQAGRRGAQRQMPPGTPPVTRQRPQQRMGGAQQPQEAGTGSRREVTWLVAVEGDFPLKIVATSQKGGTKVKEITIR
ncbi:M14 family metallopeptidase [candidate division KSB1 bacterium]